MAKKSKQAWDMAGEMLASVVRNLEEDPDYPSESLSADELVDKVARDMRLVVRDAIDGLMGIDLPRSLVKAVAKASLARLLAYYSILDGMSGNDWGQVCAGTTVVRGKPTPCHLPGVVTPVVIGKVTFHLPLCERCLKKMHVDTVSK